MSASSCSRVPKIAVIGAVCGIVVCLFSMIHRTVSEIVLIDVDRKRAEGEAMDMNHGVSFVQPVRVLARALLRFVFLGCVGYYSIYISTSSFDYSQRIPLSLLLILSTVHATLHLARTLALRAREYLVS